jgi:hypothetical protein
MKLNVGIGVVFMCYLRSVFFSLSFPFCVAHAIRRYNPGPLSFGASAEVAVRLSLVGLPLPKTSMPQAFRLVPHKEGEAMAAYEAEEHRKVVAGTALAQRATLEADVAATDAWKHSSAELVVPLRQQQQQRLRRYRKHQYLLFCQEKKDFLH